ncbi:MAG: peptidylprolyl isomerase [bacterium]|nr:peptidylprolyl isomerase [bacterium]
MLSAKILVICSLLFVVGSPMSAQKKKPAKTTKNTTSTASTSTNAESRYNNAVMATVGSENIIYADVERAFQKNMNRRETKLSGVPRDTALEFLRLYTNYRLKVMSARERGVQNDTAVKSDIANNRKLLSETFYFDKAIADARVAELTRRRTKELKVAIMLAAVVPPGQNSWDTVRSYNKALNLIRMLESGANFAQLARDSSDDKETGSNGGDLPWISGGSIIKIVEDEAYAVPAGSFSKKPVPSRFGYFIVNVEQSQPRKVVKFRHILLGPKAERDTVATERLADSLLQILRMPGAQQGAALRARGVEPGDDPFAAMAGAYSDDPASATKGGYLGSSYSRSGGMEPNSTRLLPAFENAVFALKDGEVSGKVRTLHGIHIIRLDSTKYPDEVMERDNARRTYRRQYFEEDKRLVLDSLKTVYGYAWNRDVYARMKAVVDSTKNAQDSTWHGKIPADLLNQTLYTSPKVDLTVGQFADSLRYRLDMRGFTLNSAGYDRAINKIVDAHLLEQATANLEASHPDFKALIQEFTDGILMFKVEEQEVWSKLRFDTVDARAFYDTTRSRWMTDTKYLLTEVYVTDANRAQEIATSATGGSDLAEIASKETQRDGMREKRGSLGALSAKTSKYAQMARDANTVSGGVIGPFPHDKGFVVLRLDGIEQPSPKTFEQSLTELAPAYQDALQKRLTEAWLSDVRQRNAVVINQKTINEIYK